MTVISPRHGLILAAAAVLTAGCGLGAELDREANPERTRAHTPAPPTVDPSRAGGPGGVGPAPQVEPPAATAPPGCPATGVQVTTGMVSATMGLRAMPVTLTNCGAREQRVNGYPDVRVRDVNREPMDVTVLKGPGPITQLDDPGPHPVALKPGESARSVFVWRYSAVDAATQRGSGVYVEIAPAAGVARQTVEPDGGLDIGDTGLLGTTAWQKVTD
ncbi:DUF4232 domain-containing protein [Streptomyces sp. P9(2023)]|uniref:DUF4232 domain-containing protein n=1 Tax=Streptomyces sp. P9(2023) TaxID=3064394 RepID=UPI0028F3E4D8|nr:DUF4232 domain-containing protein [Streptomyces sp. P9(2023)]MDT9687119.1 DUF4232 domain-containing protein [Streptomyces sp. P9(2023)]